MKGFTLHEGKQNASLGFLLILLLFLSVGGNARGQVAVFSEDFSGITTGDNTTSSGSGSAWKGNDNFTALTNVYEAGGMVKIGKSGASGSITTRPLELTDNYTVEFDVKGWSKIEGYIKVTPSNGTEQTFTYTALMTDATLDHAKLSFTGGAANTTVTIATSAKRAFIDNIVISNVTNGQPAGFMWGDKTDLSVTLTQGDEFTAPTFSNPNNLTVSFSSDNGAVATVSDAGVISLAGGTGTAVIRATSAADDTYDASSATCTITVNAPVTAYTDIAGIKSAIKEEYNSANLTAAFEADLTDAIVTYTNRNSAYIEDHTGGILIYTDNHGLTAGQVINGRISGTGFRYNGLREINTLDTSLATITDGATIPLTTLTLADLTADFDRYESMRVKIEEATVTDALTTTDRNGTIEQGGSTLAVYAQVANTITADLNAHIDITGFPGYYNTTRQLNVWKQSDITVHSTGQEAQAISFATPAYTFAAGSEEAAAFTGQAVSGAQTAVTYSLSGDEIATISAEDGAVTLNGQTGTATVTANAVETEDFCAATASYTITVTSDAVEVHTISWTGASDWSGIGENVISLADGNYTVGVDKSNGTTNPGVPTAGDCRAYAKAVVTLTNSAAHMTQIVFNISEQGAKRMSTITPSAGSVTYDAENKTLTWTGDASTVSFTVGEKADLGTDGASKAGQLCFKTIDITSDKPVYFDLAITAAGFATYYNDADTKLPAGVQAAIVTAEQGGKLTLDYLYDGDTEGQNWIPAHTGVVLRGAQGTYSCTVMQEGTATPEGNLLRGSVTDETTTGGAKYYMLSYDENGENLGFYWGAADGGAFENAAHKAYLPLPATFEAGRRVLILDDDATAIDTPRSAAGDPAVDVYTVEGRIVRAQIPLSRALNGLPSGIYIANGKKYIIK